MAGRAVALILADGIEFSRGDVHTTEATARDTAEQIFAWLEGAGLNPVI